jgi:hypothetical protein
MKSAIPGHEDVERVEQTLFESLRRDEPPQRARHATAAALGLGATVLTTATAGAQGGAAVAKAGPILLVKWVALGTLAAAVSVGGIRYATVVLPRAELPKPVATMTQGPRAANAPKAAPKGATPEPPPAPQARVVPAAPAEVLPPPPSREPTRAQRASDSPAKPAAPAARVRSVPDTAVENGADYSASPSGAVIPSRQLADEVAVLDQARGAVVTKDAERALDLLGRYTREFPAGMLNHEATVLRIEALFLKGSSDAATSLGREFLGAYPNSTQASRVRRLLAEHHEP